MGRNLKLAADWNTVPLSSAVSVQKGKIVSNSESENPFSKPYIGAESLDKGTSKRYVNEPGGVRCGRNDILMLWDGERSGLCGIGHEGIISSTVARLRLTNDDLYSRFLYHYLNSQFEYIQSQRTGTGVPHVPKDLTSLLYVPTPPLPEQHRIAEILDTVDETIHQTEQTIEKLQQIKQGMLDDLLTRGIDEDGNLRDPEKHPEQFLETELGIVPKEWQIVILKNATIKIQDGTHFSPQSNSGPYRYITSKNIKYGYMDISNTSWISEKEHRKIYNRCDVKPGDILLTKDGVNTGNAAINKLDEEFSLLSSVAMIRPNKQRLLPGFLLQYLLSPLSQKMINDIVSGNAITRITLEKINELPLLLPKIEEQNQIIKHTNTMDDRIKSEIDYHSKLIKLKKGLMQDLLTGKVRTNELEEVPV